MQIILKSTGCNKPNEIPILDFIGKKTKLCSEIINNANVNLYIGASGYNYYAQFGISELKGGSGIWFNDYIEYLIVAENAPAKFWGILNNKYVIAKKHKC